MDSKRIDGRTGRWTVGGMDKWQDGRIVGWIDGLVVGLKTACG